MGLYENVKQAAKEKGYSINKLEQELGFARSYIGKFKSITPSADKIQKIAEFLNVSSEYLMTGNESATTEQKLSSKDEKDIARVLDETLEQLDNDTGLMFDGDALDPKTKELLKINLENAIRTAKITAKKKFTPNKYKKPDNQ